MQRVQIQVRRSKENLGYFLEKTQTISEMSYLGFFFNPI